MLLLLFLSHLSLSAHGWAYSIGRLRRLSVFVVVHHFQTSSSQKKLGVNQSQILCGSSMGWGTRFIQMIQIMSPGSILHRIEQIGAASSAREQMTMNQRESAKQKESAKSTKPEPRDNHQSHHSQNFKAVLLLWFIFICYHIYNVCLLHDFVATLRLSALLSALYFVLSKLALWPLHFDSCSPCFPLD